MQPRHNPSSLKANPLPRSSEPTPNPPRARHGQPSLPHTPSLSKPSHGNLQHPRVYWTMNKGYHIPTRRWNETCAQWKTRRTGCGGKVGHELSSTSRYWPQPTAAAKAITACSTFRPPPPPRPSPNLLAQTRVGISSRSLLWKSTRRSPFRKTRLHSNNGTNVYARVQWQPYGRTRRVRSAGGTRGEEEAGRGRGHGIGVPARSRGGRG